MSNLRIFTGQLLTLMRNPFFLLLTFLGNSLIVLSSALFYFIERGVNEKVMRFIDALWWGFATATTTGYGDITPVTDLGKLIGILLMLIGTAIFAMFTALFADIILTSKSWHTKNKN